MTVALNRVAAAIRSVDPVAVKQAEAALREIRALLDEHLQQYHGCEGGYAAAVVDEFWLQMGHSRAVEGAPDVARGSAGTPRASSPPASLLDPLARDSSGCEDRAREAKAAQRRLDEARIAHGDDPAAISTENALIPAEVCRTARIKSIGKRFKIEEFRFIPGLPEDE